MSREPVPVPHFIPKRTGKYHVIMNNETVETELTEEVTFAVNDVFNNSFDELGKKIKKYEGKKSVQLWRRDSRTIEAASKPLT